VVRRFVPPKKAFAKDDVKRRYSDLHHKAFTARERGAVAVIVVDVPEAAKGAKVPKEAALPPLELARLSEVGIPVVVAKASVGAKLLKSRFPATVSVELQQEKKPAHNVVGVIRAGAKDKLPGVVVIGAHYDHLGFGGHTSLEPDKKAPHNGADDNASGTAALLSIARSLAAQRETLRRDVYLAAFTAEESGLIGSSYFVKKLPPGVKSKDIVAMLNMDMVGRLRSNTVSVLGGGTAAEWPELVQPACADKRVNCKLGGDGYGPSDQTPFYAVGIPVLHFFTGAHGDYHKTTDDSNRINAAGGAQVAAIVADVGARVANRQARPVHKRVSAPLPRGDSRSFGASLGTIPDYANGGGKPGVLLSGVRPGGPAEKGGIRGGDRLLKIGKTDVLSVQDMVYVLRQAQPGETAKVVVERDGKKVTLEVTFGKSARRHK
jgi:Iap family predicted aminopeptidase